MQPSERPGLEMPPSSIGVNPGYVLGQLARALTTSLTDESPDVCARAHRKVDRWRHVFEGMLSGALRVGSRAPVADTPVWATLEVVTGGFATGNLMAGGDLQPHERDLLARFPDVPGESERAALNAYYLGDDGLAELQARLANGRYRIQLPEEGALLVVAWLVQNGHADEARAVLDEIGPFFHRLRFYPIPASDPLSTTTVVHLQDVAATIASLDTVRPDPRSLQQKEAVEVWAPLYDRVAELFAETVRGSVPSLRLGPDGKPVRSEGGRFHIDGGWPCQHYPDGWADRARTALADYRRLRAGHQLCGSPESKKGGFATLRRYLGKCVAAPERLTGRDVGMIRSILAGVTTRRGLPGSERWQQRRAHQVRQVAGPTRADLARVLVGRLSSLPRDRGLPSLDDVLAPTGTGDAERFGVPAGKPVPGGLAVKVRRALDAPVGLLVELGVIPSGEVLARVVPQISSQVRAAGVADPDLRRLFGSIYAAFRRRRSLLLLNLESQVKLQELPWVRPLEARREDSQGSRRQARQVLEELVVLALTAFPQQILPNKLLQEVRALADTAGLPLPIVDELAADIFMGEFSEKFLRAAQTAARLLEGTLYERYYGLPYARVRQIDDVKPVRYGTPTSAAFGRLCVELAGEEGAGRGWSVARNGKIIEQQQIVTTQNLAVLFDALGLGDNLAPHLEAMAFRAYAWVCRRLQQRTNDWRARLPMVKNAAYAWRQILFFVSVAPTGTAESFVARAERHLREQEPGFRSRFRPALDGVARTIRGLPVEAPPSPEYPAGARRFLGWTTERHWALM